MNQFPELRQRQSRVVVNWISGLTCDHIPKAPEQRIRPRY